MSQVRRLAIGTVAAVAVGVGAGLVATAGGGGGGEPSAEAPAQRVGFAAPARGRVGQPLTLDLRRAGADDPLTVELCASPPLIGHECRDETFAPGQEAVRTTVTPRAPGLWRFEVRNRGQVVGRETAVMTAGRPLRLLATGDSMIQTVDSFLARALGERAAVESDARISTGISSPDVFDWPRHARQQARTVAPDVTVVYLGANDGFPLRPPRGPLAECCDEPWVAEYARRVEAMMRAYVRGGAGRVLWLTLPAPREGHFVAVYRPVNRAIRRAAERVPGAAVVAIDELLSPGYRFRATVRRGGREITVRQADGIHLSLEGAELAAGAVVAAMRTGRLLPPRRPVRPDPTR